MMKSAGVATVALIAAFAGAQVQVSVNGTPVQFNGAQPQMMNGRVLVPLRGVFEQMGDAVLWNSASQSVTANGGGNHVALRIGSMDATVNGKVVTMDVPPTIIDGSTMVPLRFLSESLGAQVNWQPQNNLVAITTNVGNGAAETFAPEPAVTQPPTVIIREVPRVIERPAPPAPPPPFVVTRDTVIPIRLDEQLTSDRAHNGDRFTATVTNNGARYMDFPNGTVVEGVVRQASAASGSHGGVLDLRFTDLRLPNGHTYPVDGYVRMLDDPNIVRTDNGRFVAKSGSGDNIGRDALIGAGAGLVIGSTQGKAVGGAVIGGALGALVGSLDKHLAHNVIFDRGTQFGLVLDHDLSIDREDLR